MADVDATLLAPLLRESLQKGQHPQLIITSNSMTPLLQRGDKIILEFVTIEQLQPGDILTLTTESHLQTHRYWGMEERAGTSYLLTCGDRPLSFDPLWPIGSLIGRVIARQRKGKRMSLHEGVGKWLNNQLSKLATAKLNWFNIFPGQTVPLLTPYQHLKRHSLWFVAKLLTGLVDFIN